MFRTTIDIEEPKNKKLSVLATLTLISKVNAESISQLQTLPKLVNITHLPFRIGRDPKFSDLTLDTPAHSRMISRRHCVLQYNYNTKKYLCIDQKSLNGTFINAERVGSKEIENGDCLVFTGGSSYAIGESLPVTTNPVENGSHMDISANASSVIDDPTRSRQAVEEHLCSMANTFVYKFTIVKHPPDVTVTQTISPSASANSLQSQEDATVSLQAKAGTEESKKRERTDSLEDINHAPKKARLTTELSPTELLEENNQLKQQVLLLQADVQKAKDLAAQVQNTSNHANTVLASILESEFHCSICQTLLLHPMTLQCSHTFCTTCIQQWLPKHPNCPICRKRITKQPIKNISLQGVLEKLEMLLNEEDRSERKERETQITKREEEDLQKLNAMIRDARNKGMKFLRIEDEWSEHDKNVFMAGLAKHNGTKARQLYLSLTGLNLESIAKFTGNTLQRVCNNIGVPVVWRNKSAHNDPNVLRGNQSHLLDAENTRERLREFSRGEFTFEL